MKKKIRSPNYPRRSLPEVITRLKTYAEAINLEEVSEEQIAKRIGYSGLSGAAIPYVSALKKFGLMDQTANGSFRFKDDVFNLIELTPDKYEEKQYQILIEKIAFTPDVFSELRNYFGKNFPDKIELANFLKMKNFVEKSIPKVIDSYEQTFNLVASVNEEYTNRYYGKNSIDLVSEKSVNQNKVEEYKNRNNSSVNKFMYQLTEKIEVVVQINGNPSAEEFKKLAEFQKNLEELID